MQYPDYLVHFNKNHSAKNGQFVSGDGDGDGISNDHANQRKAAGRNLQNTINKNKKKSNVGAGLMVGSLGLTAATGGLLAAYDATDNPIAAVGAIVTALGDISMFTVGAILSSQAGNEIRKATDKVIDTHYDAPISEAMKYQNR